MKNIIRLLLKSVIVSMNKNNRRHLKRLPCSPLVYTTMRNQFPCFLISLLQVQFSPEAVKKNINQKQKVQLKSDSVNHHPLRVQSNSLTSFIPVTYILYLQKSENSKCQNRKNIVSRIFKKISSLQS